MGNYQYRQIIISPSLLSSVQQQANTSSIYLNSKLLSLEEYFLLENPSRIHLRLQYKEIFFIWLQPRSERNEHLQARQIFNQTLPRFTYYETFDEVRQFFNKQNDNTVFRFIVSGALQNQAYRFISRHRSVDQVIIFCQNPSRIQDITTRYKKTNYYGHTLKQVLRLLSMPSNYQHNVLFFCQQDLPLIKKYSLNYYSFVHHRDNFQSKQDFIDLASIIFNNNLVSVQNFHQSYQQQQNNQQGKKNLLQASVFHNSFYWQIVNSLPKITSDPKRLGYLRFAFKDLFEMICRSYKQAENRNFDTVYVVTQLAEAEFSYFNQNRENYIMFTSFVKGFKIIGNANEYFKKLRTLNKKPYLFEIVLPRKIGLKEDLDFGFMVADKMFEQNPQSPTVLFNIFNIFKIINIETRINRIYLTYGALAEVYKFEQKQMSRGKMNKHQNQLLRNFDIFQCSIGKIRNQISVFNQSGCYIDSIISSQSAIAQLHNVENIQIRNQRDLILLQKGDSERLIGNFDDAIETLLLIENQEVRTLGMIHIVGIQLKRGNIQHAQLRFEYVLPRINTLSVQWGLYEYHYLARHYHSVLRMNRGQYLSAYQSMKLLKEEIIDKYDYKIGSVQFFDDITINMDRCCRHMNNIER